MVANAQRALLRILAFSSLVAAASASMGQQKDAEEFLRLSMEKARKTKVVAIQVQPGRQRGTSIKSQFEQDGKGRSRRTVLEPMRMNGVSVIDDSREWMQIFPDQETVVRMPSRPPGLPPSVKMDLIKRNYRISEEAGPKVANRDTRIVICKPLRKGMDTRRIFLDSDNAYTLRVEIESEGRQRRILDTTVIEYRSVDPERFKMSPPADFKTQRPRPPKSVRKLSDAEPLVKFKPVWPDIVPMGFMVESIDVLSENPEGGMLGIRLSDGLIGITLYQWPTSRKSGGPDWLPKDQIRKSGDIEFAVAGEVNSNILRQFADLIVQGMKFGSSPR